MSTPVSDTNPFIAAPKTAGRLAFCKTQANTPLTAVHPNMAGTAGIFKAEVTKTKSAGINAKIVILKLIINWKIGYETEFRISTGKASKYLQKYLDGDIWNRFLDTYANGNIDNIWHSVFVMCELFNDTACELERRWGHTYN